jgi:DNA-binding HxlR family transcriptional regulator
MILLKHEFIDSIEGTSTKTLSIRSKEMKEDGLIYRVVVSSRPIHTEYAVTERGKMVEPMARHFS